MVKRICVRLGLLVLVVFLVFSALPGEVFPEPAESLSPPWEMPPGGLAGPSSPAATLESYRVVATIPLTPGIGLQPTAIAADPLSPLVYVANQDRWDAAESSRDITVLSGTEVMGMIPGYYGQGCFGESWYVQSLLVHPSTGLLYAVEQSLDPAFCYSYEIYLRILSTTQVLDTLCIGEYSNRLGWHFVDMAFQPTTGYLYLLRWYTISDPPIYDAERITILDGSTTIGEWTYQNSFPLAVAADPRRGYVYISSSADVVRVLSGTMPLLTIPVSLEPFVDYHIQVQPRTGLAYVQSMGENLAILSGTTALGSITVGEVADMAAHPDNGYLYVSHPATPTLTIVSGTAVLTEVAVISPGGSLEVNPTTGLVYLRHPEAPWITVLSGTEVLAQIPAVGGNQTIRANPFTGLVYAVEGDQVIVITGTQRLTVLPQAAPQPRAMEKDLRNGRLVLLSSPPALSLIQDQEILATTSLTASVKQMVIHPESGLIYLPLSEEEAVLVMSGTTLLSTIPISATPWDIAIQPRNNLIYVSDVSGALNILSGTTRLCALPLNTGVLRRGRVAASAQSGLVYMTDPAPGLSLVHVLSGTEVITDIAVGGYPHAVSVDPYSGYTYVATDYSGGFLRLRIIRDTSLLTETIPIGSSGDRVLGMYPSAGGHFYVHWEWGVGTSGEAVTIVRGRERVAQWFFPRGTHLGLEAHPSKSYLFLGYGRYGSLFSVGVGTTLVTTMTVGEGSQVRAIAVEPDTGRVYVATDHTISILEEYLPYRFYFPFVPQGFSQIPESVE